MTLRPSVYIDTTIYSYLTARPSGKLVTAAHQRITAEWWRTAVMRYRLFGSVVVVEEASAGNPQMAERRLALLEGLALVEVTAEARELARLLVTAGLLPPAATADALHVTAMARIDYLVTWNLHHLAGAVVRRRIERALRERGLEPPTLCIPEELLANMSEDGGTDVR